MANSSLGAVAVTATGYLHTMVALRSLNVHSLHWPHGFLNSELVGALEKKAPGRASRKASVEP